MRALSPQDASDVHRRSSKESAGSSVEQLRERIVLSALFRLWFHFFPSFFGPLAAVHQSKQSAQTHTDFKLGLLCKVAPVVLVCFSLNSETQNLRWGKISKILELKKNKIIFKKKWIVIINKWGNDISVYFRIFYTVCCDSDLGNIKEIHSQSLRFVCLIELYGNSFCHIWEQ